MHSSKIPLFAFIIIPLIELWLLVSFTSEFGLLTTLVLIIATAVLGVRQLKSQGRYLMQMAQQKMAMGALPNDEIQQGLLVAVAGVLLITPGILTDGLGLLLLFPFTRQTILKYLKRYFPTQVTATQSHTAYTQQSSEHSSNVIDGEYERKDD